MTTKLTTARRAALRNLIAAGAKNDAKAWRDARDEMDRLDAPRGFTPADLGALAAKGNNIDAAEAKAREADLATLTIQS